MENIQNIRKTRRLAEARSHYWIYVAPDYFIECLNNAPEDKIKTYKEKIMDILGHFETIGRDELELVNLIDNLMEEMKNVEKPI